MHTGVNLFIEAKQEIKVHRTYFIIIIQSIKMSVYPSEAKDLTAELIGLFSSRKIPTGPVVFLKLGESRQ